MPEPLTAPAPAKINLVLEVLGKREDGYHDIATVIQTLELADVVTLNFDCEPGLTVTGRFASGTPADAGNLVTRAANELGRIVGRDGGSLHITLDKRIPAAGGLGGGASDAGTILRLLHRAWHEVTDGQLLESGIAVGSDVAFFLIGGTARATGRGERVQSLPDIVEHGVVLFVPPDTLERKTARLFAALDELPFDDGSVAGAFVANPPERLSSADIFNAFERVAFDMFPGLATLWEDLENRIGEPIRLAGAGPTLFWIGPPGEAASVAARAQGLPCTVIETRTSPSLWRP
ncbi:MAG: 4-(cytidine 5'-diphospho)-2-C-methyl-D-erythritol kinase [Dehalococcoidia bacterium]